MKISNAFPSEYLRAADLQGRNVKVTMDRVEMAELGNDHKPILFFKGKDKGLVLNKTNANNIAVVYGDDTDEWEGKELILFEAMVDFQGKTMAAIRVRPPSVRDRQPSRSAAPQPSHSEIDPPLNDDIPF